MTSNDDIVEAVRDVQHEQRVARAKDVAERVDVGKRAVLNRLETLVEEDRVERLDVGARSAVWWVDDGDDRLEDLRDRSDVVEASVGYEATGAEASVEVEGNDAFDPSLATTIGVDVDAIDLPGSGAKLDERREALRACVRYLASEGVATRSEFMDDVYPDHPARYDAGDDPAYSWWKNAMMDGLRQVAEQTDAVEQADYSGEWRFVG